MDSKTKALIDQLRKTHEALANAVPVDTFETPAAKRLRIKYLEQNPEEWFGYYFYAYCHKPDGTPTPPAQFHKDATVRILDNPEWSEVRNWSRELAKSTRTMMEVFYLTLVGNWVNGRRRRKRNVLLISNSKDNADRLLLPYMVNFEVNQRLINDYGPQVNLGNWTVGEFVTKGGAAFRAIGAGQSPRGSRNEAIRPDIILIDDIDTDEDCRNADIIDKRYEWIQEALIPTRSISNPLLLIYCGNIISEDCCVVRAAERADHVDIINIRGADGKSSWPEKNSEADIDRVLSQISYAAQQKEYFNNPMSTGKTFPEITWGDCPSLSELQFIVTYADPAPGNKDKPGAKSTQGNSRKAVFTVGRKGNKYYIYYGYLDVMGTDRFINSLYACREYVREACGSGKKPAEYYLIENNSLQDPFYDQVYRPAILTKGPEKGGVLSIMPDTRKKPEKWFRIEATLQPLNSAGYLVFNKQEKDNEHMKRLADQFKAAKPTSKQLDGPDCIEGAVYIINEKFGAMSPGSIRATTKQRSDTKGY